MTLKYIFHLSDLHIRNGDNIYCRFDEYNSVFNNTIESFKLKIQNDNLQFNEYITIITGDIFHNKNNIGNYGLLLYKNFIESLTKISKVYIFAGNHDLCQGDASQPSLVFSSTFNIDNLIILNDSQSFVIDNIGFSFVSIENTLDRHNNSGRISDLPPFPIIKDNVLFKIALFHGSFACAKLYNGDEIKDDFNNPYPLEWVQDFDYVLLGDIHKRQVFYYKNKTICGYSGSLIQQNFGEDIIEHGFLFWDLFNKNIQHFNVYNNIGFINIKQDDNQNILIRKNGKYDRLLENEIIDNILFFPKHLEIKIFSNINFDKLNALLKSFNIFFNIISRTDEKFLQFNNNSLSNDFFNKEQIHNIIDNPYILLYFCFNKK
jgi:DNA repair exonuclease SbcCD nuclease subunit